MTFHFRKAVTSEAKPLVGLYSESGRGKTKSALLLAKGFTGDMSKVGMIETESGRGEAYADDAEVGGYLVLPIRENFSPTTYGAAISAAEAAKLQCLIVDSASHEWEGVGGVLDMAAKNQEGGKKGPIVWQQPKMQHAREFMLRLTQTPIPLVIVCMRAKYPMYEIKEGHVAAWRQAGGQGKPPRAGDWARSEELDPKQSEDILYEMFIHGWIDKEHAFHGTKYTLEILREIFIDGKPITVETGRRLAVWSSGRAGRTAPNAAAAPAASQSGDTSGNAPPAPSTTAAAPLPYGQNANSRTVGSASSLPTNGANGGAGSPVPFMTVDQCVDIGDRLARLPDGKPRLLAFVGKKLGREIQSLEQIPADKYQGCLDWIALKAKSA